MNGVLRSFEVVAPVLHTFDNGKHFAVMDIVVTFCRCALARPIRDRMEKAIVRLGNDS